MVTIYPIIKWVGGKTQIIEQVFETFPTEISHYYEPFIGGGSVLFELLNRLEDEKIKVKTINIGDFNKNLINLYNSIKNEPDKLIKYIRKFKNNYDESPNPEVSKDTRKKIEPFNTVKENKNTSKEYLYYHYRNMFNKIKDMDYKPAKKSALLIFLNKTSFRGVYRENSSGKFNVPFGNYLKLELFDEKNIRNCSRLFNKYSVQFTHTDFYSWNDKIKYDNKTFVYLDPPYYPINDTSFTSYTSDDFNLEQHKKIVSLCKTINNKKSKFALSNSDVSFIKDNLKQFNIKIINCKRQINSKNPGSTTNEVLINN